MTATYKPKKKAAAPPWKLGDTIKRAGNTYAKITGAAVYSGSLHTQQWLIPVIYHDGSSGSLIPSESDEKIDPKKTFVVLDAMKTRLVEPIALEDFVSSASYELEIKLDKDNSDENRGIAEAILADRMACDAIDLEPDLRIVGDPDDAAIVTVEELFK